MILGCIGYNASQRAQPAGFMTHLPYLSVMQLTGIDVASFLQGQLTADIAALAPGKSTFAGYCSPRGQVIALVLVGRHGDDWFMVVESSLAVTVVTRLKKFVMRAKVSFAACPELQLAGLPAHAVAASDNRVFSPHPTTLRYVLTTPQASAESDVIGWRRSELWQGVGWLQAATSERFLPQMLGLDAIGALSFSKGCYPGQEIVARTHYLGKLKRHNVLVQVEGAPALHAGDSCRLLSNGQQVDAVVVELVQSQDEPAMVMLVAPVDSSDVVTAILAHDQSWPAQRPQAWATM